MKKRIVLALCSLLIAGAGIGMTSIPHEELPVSEELLAEAMAEEEAEEIIEETAEVKVCEEGCTLEEGHEGECELKKEDIVVILKSTSMERDLKVKFVNKATGKVISGADFKMKVTSPSKNSKEYSDHDNDGIIWVKDIDGGNYTVEMLELEGYVQAEVLKAEVKNKIEYKVVEVADEVKTEKEVEVSKEDASYGGNDKDESTSSSVVLKDTVKYVASSVEKVGGVQKKDDHGQLVYKEFLYENGVQVYSERALDPLGQEMYAVVLSESANFHEDKNSDQVCDRCKADLRPACEHTDANGDKTCDKGCGATDLNIHSHTENEGGVCTGCDRLITQDKHTACTNKGDGTCKYCGETIAATSSCEHADANGDGTCDKEGCGVSGLNIHTCTPDENGACTGCGQTVTNSSENGVDPAVVDPDLTGESAKGYQLKNFRLNAFGMVLRPFGFFGAEAPQPAAETGQYIKYDTSSAKVYNTKSKPLYDTSSEPVYESEPKTVYKGWQTIDGATYYFDENGNKVTGQQVIQGISYTFSSDGVRSGTIGIDVSKYQRNINWKKIKNAGVNFVIIRCGYRGYGSGVLVQDEMFVSHITGAKAAGLRVGIYFFSQAINEAEAVEEASMAVELARKYGVNMPIAIDSEYANGGKGRADGLSKSARTKVTRAFCNTVKSAGYTPMVYASKSWFANHLDVSQLSGYRIWVAHYAEKCGYTGTYHIWQHTDKGKVDGYSGYLDMNISSI